MKNQSIVKLPLAVLINLVKNVILFQNSIARKIKDIGFKLISFIIDFVLLFRFSNCFVKMTLDRVYFAWPLWGKQKYCYGTQVDYFRDLCLLFSTTKKSGARPVSNWFVLVWHSTVSSSSLVRLIRPGPTAWSWLI